MAKSPQAKATRTTKTSTAKVQADKPDFFNNIRLQSRLLFAFACLLYANTLGHGFVLDDGLVITENAYTQAGFSGIWDILSHDSFYGFFQQEGMDTLVAGGRYRPMSLMLFAVVYQFAGANPLVFHLVTVLLFALTVWVLYRMLLRLLNRTDGGHLIAWLAAALFAAHPIHTEVVANVKSCDEILALLGALAALHFTLLARDTGQQKWAFAAGISFLLACLSKEIAVAYALLIPAALWFFRTGNYQPSKSILGTAWPSLAAVAAFLVVRGSIVPWTALTPTPLELMNNPFLKLEGGAWAPFDFMEKLATIFYTLWKYVQLLVFPYPQTHDYYPRQVDVLSFGNPFSILGLALYALMAFFVVRGFKKGNLPAFSLLLYLLPLGIVSNLVFPIGTNMSERFVFMPSVGFCLLAAALLAGLVAKNNPLGWRIFVVAMVLFSIKTIHRNRAWASNEQLYKTDIQTSENSIKLQNAYAQVLLDRAKISTNVAEQQALGKEALNLLNRSFKLYPDFVTSYLIRGGVYTVLQQFPEALADYRKALSLAPENEYRKNKLAYGLQQAGLFYGQQKSDLASAFKYLNESWQLNPKDAETVRLIGVGHMVQGNKDLALEWLTKAEQVAPENAEALWELGVAYSNLGMPEKAQALQKKAYDIDPTIVDRVQTRN